MARSRKTQIILHVVFLKVFVRHSIFLLLVCYCYCFFNVCENTFSEERFSCVNPLSSGPRLRSFDVTIVHLSLSQKQYKTLLFFSCVSIYRLFVFPSPCSTRGCTPSASSVTRWWRRGPTHHQPATSARATIVHDGLTQLALFIVNKILLFPDCLFHFTNKCCHPVHSSCLLCLFLWKNKHLLDWPLNVMKSTRQPSKSLWITHKSKVLVRLLLLEQLW